MGLAVRDDPPKVIDFAKRDWGETREGLSLSAEVVRNTDPFSLSVVIRNTGSDTKRFTVPGWLHFYSLEVRDRGGNRLALTPYGRAALDPSRRIVPIDAKIEPGGWIETLIPLGSFFNLKGQPGLTVEASATLPSGEKLTSNAAPA